jgi:hypothetical protein
MRLWRRARNDDLLDRTFLLATSENDLPPGEHVVEAELDIGIVSTHTSDGRPALPLILKRVPRPVRFANPFAKLS